MVGISPKEQAARILEQLPDDCSIEDIQYQLYVVETLRRRLEMADRIEAISQEDAEKRLAKGSQSSLAAGCSDDLETIAGYIANDSPRYASIVAETVFSTATLLADFPRSGRTVPEWDDETLRERIVSVIV